jgi:hypothetical protein
MVNAATAFDTGSASSSLYTRAASAAVVLSSDGEAAPAAANGTKVANLAETLRYNSFEFSYRQDFGKIVLLRQEPETGELVQQFPSEYYLQKYAQSERVARQSQANANDPDGGSGGDVVDVAAAQVQGVGSGDFGGTGAAVDVAPSVPAAPSLPSGGVSAPRVDITI